MSGKYIKLIAKPDTWFKENTEVLGYNGERITKEYWSECQKSGIIACRGIRVCESEYELHTIGEEYEDSETCLIEEFDIYED